MNADIIDAAEFRRRSHAWLTRRRDDPESPTDPEPEPEGRDPNDVLALLASQPVRTPVTTGTPLDDLAADHIGLRTVVVLLGDSESGKTATALASAATVLRAGGAVMVHVADRDSFAGAARLARLLGVEPGELADGWPSLRVRTGPIKKSVDMLATMPGPVRLLVCDSLQTAAEDGELPVRVDAAPHERIAVVLRELRRGADAGALVIVTSEQAPTGDARLSHAVRYRSDVRAVCGADRQGRFNLEVVKPRGRGRRWYRLDDDGWLHDVTAAERPADQVAALAREATRRPGKRRASNAPARSEADIEADIRAYLADHPGASQRAVESWVTGRRETVRTVLRRVRQEGA